jgi:hypothetical protein
LELVAWRARNIATVAAVMGRRITSAVSCNETFRKRYSRLLIISVLPGVKVTARLISRA